MQRMRTSQLTQRRPAEVGRAASPGPATEAAQP
jgi:hypothetical protein